MATTTTNFGWDIPQSTDLVKDGATAIAALGQDIDTALVDLKGGTTGQVLAKASGTDLDFSWVAQDDSNAIQNAIVDAKGDLISATAADTPARLAVGTNGQVLTADSSTATGLKWAAAAGGGKVLQVVQGTLTTTFDTTSTTFVDTGLTVSITPSASTSRILVFASVPTAQTYTAGSDDKTFGRFQLVRGSTSLQEILFGIGSTGTSSGRYIRNGLALSYVDSPATTSSTTYKIQARGQDSSQCSIFASGINASIIVLEIGA